MPLERRNFTMISIKGIYDGKTIKPLQPIPIKKEVNVIITLLDDDSSDTKTVAEQYNNYYQNLTSKEHKEDASLSKEFSHIDIETVQMLEDCET